jgi:uncharacterized membrane protein YphA (DoxX/SURF4 family)
VTLPLASPAAVLRALIAAIVLLGAAIVVGGVLGSGLTFLGVALWLDVLGVAAAGVFLIVRGRPIAGAGAVVTAISILVAFQYQIPAIVWTVLFFVGIGLIVWGTKPDTPFQHAWVVLLPRVAFGWAWVDNAQDHFRTGWLPGGAPYLQIANGAISRAATYFLDPPYQAFLSSTAKANPDVWASLTLCGELTWGLFLAIGLFTPVAAIGSLWQSANYVLMKSFVSHGAYTDKVFFAADLFSLVANAGQAYGLDASLKHHVPGWVATTLMGVPPGEDEPVLTHRAAPA